MAEALKTGGNARQSGTGSITPLNAHRSRNWSGVLVAVLVIAGGALGSMLLWQRANDREEVLVAAHDLAPGVPIKANDFRTVEVKTTGPGRFMSPSAMGEVVGNAPIGPVPAGTLVNARLFSTRNGLRTSETLVGAALELGQIPAAALPPGTKVNVFVLVRGDVTKVGDKAVGMVGQARVHATSPMVQGAKILVSLEVSNDLAPSIAQAAQDGLLRIGVAGDAP